MKTLQKILEKTNQGGDYKGGKLRISLLCDSKGLILASTDSEYDPEEISALSSLVGTVVDRAERDIGFESVDEVSLVNDNKVRFVCRPFVVKEKMFILVVVTPPYKPYRALTNRAIEELSNALKERV